MCIKKYRWFKHHAWAGLALITVLLSIRYLFEIPHIIFIPILSILIVYVVISLIGTYIHSKEVLEEKEIIHEDRLKKKIEKEKMKLEKKKAKLEYKIKKKQKKL